VAHEVVHDLMTDGVVDLDVIRAVVEVGVDSMTVVAQALGAFEDVGVVDSDLTGPQATADRLQVPEAAVMSDATSTLGVVRDTARVAQDVLTTDHEALKAADSKLKHPFSYALPLHLAR